MINVSDGFKKAIKDNDREIHGYVEVKYQDNSYDLDVTNVPTLSDIVLNDGSGLISNKKIMKKYAILDDNYTLLDGSFMVWNTNIIDSTGIITNDVFENIIDTTIQIENDSPNTLVNGITIYFKENLPFDFDVNYFFTDDTTIIDSVRNNTNMIYQYIFEEGMNISKITFQILNVEYPKHRLKIASVDFNISDLYENDQLINFDVSEEIDLLLANVPVNTCTLNINNYPDSHGNKKFDPINPIGLTKFLTNDSTLEPYIGVLTNDNGIEYVKLGKFYVSDWSSNDNGNVTINGKSLMDKLKSQQLHSDGTFFYNNNYYWSSSGLSSYLSANNGYTFKVNIPNFVIFNDVLKHTEIMDYLRAVTICGQESSNNRIFQVNRNNEITISLLNNTVVDAIPRTFLLQDANYTIKEPIRYLKFTAMKNAHNTSVGTKDVLNLTYSLNSPSEYIWINIDNNLISYSPSFPKTFTYTTTGTGTATLIDVNNRLAYLYLEGEEGETFTLHLTTTVWDIDGNITTTIKNNDVGETISVNVEEYFRINDGDKRNNICKGIMNLNKKYNIQLETIGDPSLEIGDTVWVQTRYTDINDGYKNMIITKQHFTFDGGLRCELEGVGD